MSLLNSHLKMLLLVVFSILLPSSKPQETTPIPEFSSYEPIFNTSGTYYLTEESITESNYSFSKCFCGPLQGWNGSHCIDLPTNTFEDILSRLGVDYRGTLDDYLAFVEVSGNLCLSDEKEYAVNEGSFYLTSFGDLYHKDSHMIFTKGQFCLEYIHQENASTIQASLCVPKPRVSLCCQDEGSCNVAAQSVPVLFGGSPIQWQSFKVIPTSNIECNDGETVKEISLTLDGDSLSFHYVSGEVRPFWTSPNPISEGHFFPINSYCLFTNDTSNSTFAFISGRFCYFDQVEEHKRKCASSVCVRKCCPEGKIYDTSQKGCTFKDPQYQWKREFFDQNSKLPSSPPRDLVLEHDFPWCKPERPYFLDPQVNPEDKFLLLDNGSMYISLSKIAMPPSKYCIDTFANEVGEFSVKALSCFLEEPPKEVDRCREVHRKLSSWLIIISCIFLAITLFVYAAVPELHAKLHGKSLLSHVTSLLVAYLCQLIVSWSSSSLNMTGCKLVALCNQVSFLWAFFWLNVMCFDIWWTLKSMSPSPETGENTRRRFALYSAYAWGCPLVIGFITGIVEFLPRTLNKSGFILPGFGVRWCWFQDKKSTWIYFHGFTLTLYVLNILFFIHVAAILIMSQRSTQGILRTTRKQHTERVFLYLRLFAVMGISWICEVISWQEGTCIYWIVPDAINSSQGIFLFFIFMCNRKVLEKVKAKWLPVLQRIKALVRTPSVLGRGRPSNTSSSQRTQQESVESSSRRLSSSSLQPCDTMQVPLNTLVAKKDTNADVEKDSSSAS